MPTAQRDEQSGPFFDGLAAGGLLVLRCQDCEAWTAPSGFYANPHPSIRCPSCGGARVAWTPTEGTGRVVTWTTDPQFPSVFDGTPGQTSGLVELTEGPWVAAALDVPEVDLAEGMPVVFESVIPPAGGEPVPAFRAATPAGMKR
jgi:uncharacterized OB-fold protein